MRISHAVQCLTFLLPRLLALLTGLWSAAGLASLPSPASRYADLTFAGTVPLLENAYYTATATDAQGRKDTNTVIGQFPASTSYTYDVNGNLTAADGKLCEYDDENRLLRITPGGSAWKTEFFYDARGRLSARSEYDFWYLQN